MLSFSTGSQRGCLFILQKSNTKQFILLIKHVSKPCLACLKILIQWINPILIFLLTFTIHCMFSCRPQICHLSPKFLSFSFLTGPLDVCRIFSLHISLLSYLATSSVRSYLCVKFKTIIKVRFALDRLRYRITLENKSEFSALIVAKFLRTFAM